LVEEEPLLPFADPTDCAASEVELAAEGASERADEADRCGASVGRSDEALRVVGEEEEGC
jgi:hypothetical protein